jgi:hypothetical protein
MDASDLIRALPNSLRAAGRPHMDQGRKRRDQMDAAVMPLVCRQRRPPSASRTGLQSWEFPAHAGNAGADQELVDDEPKGKSDQDRREDREPRPLRRLSDGRGRHFEKFVRRRPAAHRGTAAAAGYVDRVRRLHITHFEPNPWKDCVQMTRNVGVHRQTPPTRPKSS